MEEAVRVFILLFTVIALIYILSHQPRQIVVINTPYCEMATYIAFKNRRGEWQYRWVPDFGPCTHLDRYENV